MFLLDSKEAHHLSLIQSVLGTMKPLLYETIKLTVCMHDSCKKHCLLAVTVKLGLEKGMRFLSSAVSWPAKAGKAYVILDMIRPVNKVCSA